MYICILICWHIAIKMFFFGLLEKSWKLCFDELFFFLKEPLLKISLLCLKYKLFSCVCPGPGLLNSKLEFSIQKAQRTQQPMSISLSKFASLSLLCGKWKWMYFTYVHIWIHQNHNLMVKVNIAPNWVQNVTYKITIFLFIFHLEHLWNSIVKVSRPGHLL